MWHVNWGRLGAVWALASWSRLQAGTGSLAVLARDLLPGDTRDLVLPAQPSGLAGASFVQNVAAGKKVA